MTRKARGAARARLVSVLLYALLGGVVGSASLGLGAADEPPMAPPEPVEAATPGAAPVDSTQAPAAGSVETQTSSDAEASRAAWLDELGLSGSLRGALWSSNKRLDDEDNIGVGALWLQLGKSVNEDLSVFLDARAAVEGIGNYSEDQSELREAYIDWRIRDWDFRFGKQIIAWGRADRINPTDNLTPRDLMLLAPEEDDNRFGSLAAKATFNVAGYGLTGIWLPDFEPTVFPLPALDGVRMRETEPNSARQWALKLERSGKPFDWSVSYFDGFDLLPDMELAAVTPAFLRVDLNHNRLRVLGADAATAIGPWGLRAEIAYARTEDSDGDNPAVKNPFWYGVVGVERSFLDNLNVNVQLFTRYVIDWRDPEDNPEPLRSIAIRQAIFSHQLDRRQYGLTLRVSKKWLNDTLEAEIASIYNFTQEDFALRPKLVYAINDQWRATLGAEYYDGDDESFFGQFEDNRALFTELRYGF